MQIREASIKDSSAVKSVHLKAFDSSENEIISNLAVNLIHENSSSNIISLVATDKEKIIGNITLSPVYLNTTNEHFGYILAPLAVLPKYQNNKIGSTLVKQGLNTISSQGAFIVFVYGDPKYYYRFGFNNDLGQKYKPPYALEYPEAWQALKLNSTNFPESGGIKCVKSLNNPKLW